MSPCNTCKRLTAGVWNLLWHFRTGKYARDSKDMDTVMHVRCIFFTSLYVLIMLCLMYFGKTSWQKILSELGADPEGAQPLPSSFI